jgi:hypothetical protein
MNHNICEVCSIKFVPKKCRPQQRFCSSACRHPAIYNSRVIWASKNKDRVRQSKDKWLRDNPEKRKQVNREYMKRNQEYYTQYATLYIRRLNKAKPKWVNEEQLLAIYKEAKERGLEVDHIIPLKHPLVCGLHVPNNLQLLTRTQNARKSNRFCNDDILCSYS